MKRMRSLKSNGERHSSVKRIGSSCCNVSHGSKEVSRFKPSMIELHSVRANGSIPDVRPCSKASKAIKRQLV